MNPARDILVIEDEPMVTRAVVMVCSEEGLSITAVDSAREALRCLERDHYRLVVCDIMMQGMDGFQLMEAMLDRGDATPVIMMTGYSTMENAVRSLAMGAVDYIPKPFTAEELITVINRSLRSGMLLDKADSPGLEQGRTFSYVPCPGNYYRLGYVSWVLMEDEGMARVGVSDLFLKAVDGVHALELSPPGEFLVQGVPCALATAGDGSEHGIMCPMGGKIIEVNKAAETNPSLVEKDPYFRGWLYRILPSNPESNLQWLSL